MLFECYCEEKYGWRQRFLTNISPDSRVFFYLEFGSVLLCQYSAKARERRNDVQNHLHSQTSQESVTVHDLIYDLKCKITGLYSNWSFPNSITDLAALKIGITVYKSCSNWGSENTDNCNVIKGGEKNLWPVSIQARKEEKPIKDRAWSQP